MQHEPLLEMLIALLLIVCANSAEASGQHAEQRLDFTAIKQRGDAAIRYPSDRVIADRLEWERFWFELHATRSPVPPVPGSIAALCSVARSYPSLSHLGTASVAIRDCTVAIPS